MKYKRGCVFDCLIRRYFYSSLIGTVRNSMRKFCTTRTCRCGYVVLTASNEAQAQAYRAQISYRLKHQMLPEKTHYAVLPDPDGKRVGSGGATLNGAAVYPGACGW